MAIAALSTLVWAVVVTDPENFLEEEEWDWSCKKNFISNGIDWAGGSEMVLGITDRTVGRYLIVITLLL